MDEKDKLRLLSHTNVRGNVRYITITDNQQEHFDQLINIAKANYSWWAYIFHDKDNTEKHLHLLCYDKGGTSLKAHCERFSSVIPSNFVCKVFNPRAMARYLIHKDNPEKFQYSSSEVFTSNLDKYMHFLCDEYSDVTSEYDDLCQVWGGFMSVKDFLEKYRGQMSDVPFHHRVNVYQKLYSGARDSCPQNPLAK